MRLSPCVQCRQARDICAALKEGGPDPVGQGEDRLDDGNLNFVAELDLGDVTTAQRSTAV
jgi:hypothetical protein